MKNISSLLGFDKLKLEGKSWARVAHHASGKFKNSNASLN
jgi:hypothetical protein